MNSFSISVGLKPFLQMSPKRRLSVQFFSGTAAQRELFKAYLKMDPDNWLK